MIHSPRSQDAVQNKTAGTQDEQDHKKTDRSQRVRKVTGA
jgi:hypothetical protein